MLEHLGHPNRCPTTLPVTCVHCLVAVLLMPVILSCWRLLAQVPNLTGGAGCTVLLTMLTIADYAQDLKQLLEQEHRHKLEVRETLLMTIAVLGLHTRSPSAQLLVLAVLVGRLDDLDPGIRSYAAELLLGKAKS